MKILLIDAYDSFVHIIYQYLLTLDAEVDVIRNDKVTNNIIVENNYDLLVFGPGPGHPRDSGYLKIISDFQDKIPMFGICLGMQAMVMAYGGNVIKSNNIMHGKSSYIAHEGNGLFKDISNPLKVARYHSLIADKMTFPHDILTIMSTSNDDGNIMAVRHKTLPIQGVQFHPESIITDDGISIFNNILKRI